MPRLIGDIISGFVVLGALTSVLPAIAAGLSIVWLILRIWESDTVRGWSNRRDK